MANVRNSILIAALLFSCAPTPAATCPQELAATAPPITTCFVPGDDCEARIVALIDGAKKSLRVIAYSFTSTPIADAIVRAHQRHVDVGVVLDSSNRSGNGSKLSQLVAAGVPTWIDGVHAILHEKIIEIDGLIVEAGSYNYSASAQSRNAEDVIVMRSKAIAAQYVANWETHRAHSEVVK